MKHHFDIQHCQRSKQNPALNCASIKMHMQKFSHRRQPADCVHPQLWCKCQMATHTKQTNQRKWWFSIGITESDLLSDTYLACCSHHHACTHGFSNTGHDTTRSNISSVCRVTVATYPICTGCVCVFVCVFVCDGERGGRGASEAPSSRLWVD